MRKDEKPPIRFYRQSVSVSEPRIEQRSSNMADLTKRAASPAPKQAEGAASRLKNALMEDALGRMFGEDGEKTMPGTPRVILALANHAHTAGWDRACLRYCPFHILPVF